MKFLVLFVFLIGNGAWTLVEAQSSEKPWYEALPAVAMDYKVHIDAGKEDCYFQYVQPGAAFYVSFQVSKTCCNNTTFCNVR